MSDAETVAERLKRARTARGLTQAVAAQSLGITEPQLSKWETGKNVPGTASLEKLARAYGTTVPALLGHSTDAAASDDREHLAYWRGRMESAARALEAMAGLVASAQADVSGLLAAGILGAPGAPRRGALPPDGIELYATRAQAEAEAAGSRTPTRKRAG